MNLTHLAAFHAVALEGSISRGATRLLVSQPAVSKQIHELEKALKVTLLDRLPRGIRLTGAGQVLAGYAQRLFALEAEAHHAIDAYLGLRLGRLAVGASQTTGIHILPELFVQFRKTHPDIDLQVEITNTRIVQRRLIDHAIDLALTEGTIEDDRLEAEVFRTDDLVPIAPIHHPLLRKRAVTPEDLCSQPFIVRETGSGTLSVAERALAERGLRVSPVMSLGSTEAIKRAVAAGIGIAIVSRQAITLELRARELAIIHVKGLQIVRPLHLVRVRGRALSPAAHAFTHLLRASSRAAASAPRSAPGSASGRAPAKPARPPATKRPAPNLHRSR